MLKRVFNVGKIGLVGVVLNFLLVYGVRAMEDVESGNCINTSSETTNKENESVVAKYLDGDNMLYSNNNAAVGKFVKVDSGQYNVWLNSFKNKLLREYNNLISDSDCAEMVNKFGLKQIKNINEVRDVYKDSLNAAREWLEYELISKFLSKGPDAAAVCSKVCEFWRNYMPCREGTIFGDICVPTSYKSKDEIEGSCASGGCRNKGLDRICDFCRLMEFYKNCLCGDLCYKFRSYNGIYGFSEYFMDPFWSKFDSHDQIGFYSELYENGFENYSEQYIEKLYIGNNGEIKTNIEPSLRNYYYKTKGKFPFFVQFVNMFVSGAMCSALVSIKEMENDLFNNSFAGSSKYLDGCGCVNLCNNAGKVIEDSFNMDKFVSCFDKRVEERLKLTFSLQ